MAKTATMAKKNVKDYHLGVRISREYQTKLEKRRVQMGDDKLSQTARRILQKGLDNGK